MYEVRSLRPADVELVGLHRYRMFKEAGWSEEALSAMSEPFRQWLLPRLQDRRYVGWAIEADGGVAAGIGMIVIDWPPHPSHPDQDRRGYILNLFVEPAHRRAGLASRLMGLATDEAKRRDIALMVLHATEIGRPLYDKLGWRPTTEMALSLT